MFCVDGEKNVKEATIIGSILGAAIGINLMIGARLERRKLKKLKEKRENIEFEEI